MDRNPETCRNSVGFDGVYICRLACLPCAALKKCALAEVEDMAKETGRLMKDKRETEKRKKKN